MSWKDVGIKWMLVGCLSDDVRRRHLLYRIIESLIPALVVLYSSLLVLWLFGFHVPPWLQAILIVIGEYVLFEGILEPYTDTGNYWERAPHEGEVFQEQVEGTDAWKHGK